MGLDYKQCGNHTYLASRRFNTVRDVLPKDTLKLQQTPAGSPS